MNPITRRLCMSLVLLGVAGPAAAQTVAPPNVHFLVDTSGSMKELPQLKNSNHVEFFSITTNGCSNPRLDAMQVARGWDPNTVYPLPDVGTGVGTDLGFPNLFQDSKFYGYMYWSDLSNPPPQWNTREAACQGQVPDWSGARAADYQQCLSCLSTKGYYKLPEAEAVNSGDLTNPNFILWGRFLNFNPPKYVTMRAVLKQVLEESQSTRVGYSHFENTALSTYLARRQNAACDVARADPNALEPYRASYINSINMLYFSTSTPLARSLLNIGYYFTSDIGVYRDVFGFSTGYSYPSSFQNSPLDSQTRSVCWGCQHSAVVIITDGEPSNDSLSPTVITRLRTLNGGPVYCPDTEPCGAGPSPSQRDKGATASYADDHSFYYLDDVAKLLATQDLQRNTPAVVGEFDTSGQQRLAVHAVGYGWHSNLLKNTAAVGGGQYHSVSDAAGLRQALQAILADVQTRAEACTLP
jgi:type IV pilus assembly protein PilY1